MDLGVEVLARFFRRFAFCGGDWFGHRAVLCGSAGLSYAGAGALETGQDWAQQPEPCWELVVHLGKCGKAALWARVP